MSEVKDILIKLGYKLMPEKDGWRTNAMFRGGDNKTALKIFNNGNWCDFVQSQRGTLSDLVKLTLGLDEAKAKAWLKSENITDYGSLSTTTLPPKIILPATFSPNVLIDLIPNYDYWTNREISLVTSQLFLGGLCLNSSSLLGKMKNRQILVIYNSHNQIVGFTGRDITNESNIKWKHLGEKTNWVWPAYLNNKIITELKEVILVESPADVLRMWDCGIKNVICLFGTDCHHSVLNFLIKKNPRHIIIATNNEESQVGNEAATKIYNRLKRYFNLNQLHIKLPYKKDFCMQTCKENKQWYIDRLI